MLGAVCCEVMWCILVILGRRWMRVFVERMRDGVFMEGFEMYEV